MIYGSLRSHFPTDRNTQIETDNLWETFIAFYFYELFVAKNQQLPWVQARQASGMEFIGSMWNNEIIARCIIWNEKYFCIAWKQFHFLSIFINLVLFFLSKFLFSPRHLFVHWWIDAVWLCSKFAIGVACWLSFLAVIYCKFN